MSENPTSPLGVGGLGRSFPASFFLFVEGFTISLPPPLDLDGGGREVSEGTFSAKTAARAPQRAQDELQDGSRWAKMPQDGSVDVPIGPKTAPRRLQEAKELSKEASKMPKSFH